MRSFRCIEETLISLLDPGKMKSSNNSEHFSFMALKLAASCSGVSPSGRVGGTKLLETTTTETLAIAEPSPGVGLVFREEVA